MGYSYVCMYVFVLINSRGVLENYLGYLFIYVFRVKVCYIYNLTVIYIVCM